MQNNPKRIVKKYRNKLLSEVMEALTVLKSEVEQLQKRQINIENSLHAINQYNENSKRLETLSISDKEVLTKIFTGIKIYLDPSDMAVAAQIAVDGIWEQEITKAWLKVIKPDHTVFDIGANFGYFGLLAGQFTDKKLANIVFFEANKNLIPYINKSVSINWFNEQSTVENLAISDTDGTATLSVLKNYVGSSSLQTPEHLDSYMHEKMQLEVGETLKVPSITIDNYCAKHKIDQVNLIKMDIEGFEEKAYDGMRETVKRSRDITLFIEFTKQGYDNPKKFYEQMLKDFGNVYTIDNQGRINKPKDNSYEMIIGKADDWVMPVFSKNTNLHAS